MKDSRSLLRPLRHAVVALAFAAAGAPAFANEATAPTRIGVAHPGGGGLGFVAGSFGEHLRKVLKAGVDPRGLDAKGLAAFLQSGRRRYTPIARERPIRFAE